LQILFAGVTLFAVSDSAFHKNMPAVAATYALPKEWVAKFGLQRFGYHGLSLESISDKLRPLLGYVPKRVIVCHLGSGSSITALKNGESIDTSMGFSPLEGLVMATRAGNIDSSIVCLLAEKSGLSPLEIQQRLNSVSGLLAIGGNKDIRQLLEMEKSDDKDASLALQLFVYNIRQYIGSYIATLNGIDALVFTGTIGERSAIIRARILENFDFLKLKLSNSANQKLLGETDGTINSSFASVKILVLCADEASIIAKNVKALLN
jgi:acetate kinase